MVQGLNGEIGLPGGSSQPGESAQCTAFRETWEETGLRLQPRELLEVFDTGFHLYRCEHDALSGVIDPPLRFEVRAALYLSADQFHTYECRFKEQEEALKGLLLRRSSMTADYCACNAFYAMGVFNRRFTIVVYSMVRAFWQTAQMLLLL